MVSPHDEERWTESVCLFNGWLESSQLCPLHAVYISQLYNAIAGLHKLCILQVLRPVFDCATYSHGGDCLDQWDVGITVSNVVAYINECLKEFGRKQSSKLSPISLCTIQIPKMVRDEQVSIGSRFLVIIITTSVLSMHFSAVLLTIQCLHFSQEWSVLPVGTHHFPVIVYDGCVVKWGWHARTVCWGPVQNGGSLYHGWLVEWWQSK